jgi:hypothetical protein
MRHNLEVVLGRRCRGSDAVKIRPANGRISSDSAPVIRGHGDAPTAFFVVRQTAADAFKQQCRRVDRLEPWSKGVQLGQVRVLFSRSILTSGSPPEVSSPGTENPLSLLHSHAAAPANAPSKSNGATAGIVRYPCNTATNSK